MRETVKKTQHDDDEKLRSQHTEHTSSFVAYFTAPKVNRRETERLCLPQGRGWGQLCDASSGEPLRMKRFCERSPEV